MRNIFLKFIGIFLVLSVIIITGCKKEDSIVQSGDNITDEEWIQIQQSVEYISVTADSILLTSDPVTGWQQKISNYANLDMIESAFIADGALVLKIKKGGQIIWSKTHEAYTPPDNLEKPIIKNSENNSKVLLINQQYEDEAMAHTKPIIDELHTYFSNLGFIVDVKNADQANIDLFQNELNKYFIIYDISHGGYINNHTWLSTGQKHSNWNFIRNLETWWRDNEICVLSNNVTINGIVNPVSYYCISENFIQNRYSSNSFPNSFIYLSGCQTFKSQNDELANAFINKGAGAVVGWDESNCVGQSSGRFLLILMSGGLTLQEGITLLPAANKLDHVGEHSCPGPTESNLVFLPQSALNYKIVNTSNGSVQITTPVNGNTYYNRVVDLQGYLENAVSLSFGRAEISKPPYQGISINLIPNGGAFSQQILLRNGTNNIKVVCNGLGSNGIPIAGTLSINVTGVLPALNVGTELRWNTDYSDVDFHLLPPNSSLSDLWTTRDCYYNNANTSWGGVLDVDDVNGYGPEHITIQNYQLTGDYRLFIHYYSDHGISTPTDGFASIFTFEGDWNNFGPYRIENDGGNNLGDLWEVCRISMPSGTITPVNQRYNLGDYIKQITIPSKKR
ncbi:MAG: hypothetical protein K8I03_11825 [Ignavibacteria bacterium]|nr:hypothetical protein [Ignavibacteria bacterium]